MIKWTALIVAWIALVTSADYHEFKKVAARVDALEARIAGPR